MCHPLLLLLAIFCSIPGFSAESLPHRRIDRSTWGANSGVISLNAQRCTLNEKINFATPSASIFHQLRSLIRSYILPKGCEKTSIWTLINTWAPKPRHRQDALAKEAPPAIKKAGHPQASRFQKSDRSLTERFGIRVIFLRGHQIHGFLRFIHLQLKEPRAVRVGVEQFGGALEVFVDGGEGAGGLGAICALRFLRSFAGQVAHGSWWLSLRRFRRRSCYCP